MFVCLESEKDPLSLAREISPVVERLDATRVLCRAGEISFPPTVRVGLGPSRFVAELALNFANPLFCVKDSASFLAPLPIDHLPIDEEMLRKLNLLGIETMGHLQQFSRGDLASLFGREGHLVWELCRGIDDRPLIPEIECDAPQATIPIEEWGPPALQPLLPCKQLLVIWGHCQLKVNFSQGIRDPYRAFDHISARMSGKRWPFVEEVRVVVTKKIEPKSEQLMLFGKSDTLPKNMMKIVWDDRSSPLPERWAHLENGEGTLRCPLLMPKMRRVRGEVLEQWKVKEDWWHDPIERSYFRILTQNGGYIRIFLEKGTWYVH